MTAAETIEQLIKLGVVVNDAVSKKGNGKADLGAFLTSPQFQAIGDSVKQLLATLTEPDFKAAIEAIDAKQSALLGSGTLADLSTDKLLQYSQLGNVKLVLAAKQVAAAANPQFLQWLTQDALPVLVQAAPAIVPLLL